MKQNIKLNGSKMKLLLFYFISDNKLSVFKDKKQKRNQRIIKFESTYGFQV